MTTLEQDHRQRLEAVGVPAVPSGFVGGSWLDPNHSERLDIEDPSVATAFAQFAEADAEDVDRAVQDTRRAWQREWRSSAPAARGRILAAVAKGIRDQRDNLAYLESLDTGKPLSQARADIEVSARYFEYYAGAADKLEGSTIPQPPGTFAYTRREPLGVVAHVTPWNAPLSQMTRGVAPSLAVGNGVVVKPSDLTVLTSLAVARLMVEAGLPAGVCNVIPGRGITTGESLVLHPLVDHVTFTGSVAVGRRVAGIAADRIVGCSLELGGKSPTIVMPDADLDKAAHAGALAVIRNSGQSCFATTRLIVHRSVYEQFLDRVAAVIAGLTVGHGLDDPDLGPLVSARQRDRVVDRIEGARRDGARVVVDGRELTGPRRGYFVGPTLLADVTNGMTVAREEVFGPIQSVIAFDQLDEAVAIANDTNYGLSAGIFTRDVGVAISVADRLEAGQVQVNRYTGAGVEVPFGGYKNSGLGREKGLEAMHQYSQVKSVIVATS
jgi:aldehyde dehydrogenase (NAD+)